MRLFQPLLRRLRKFRQAITLAIVACALSACEVLQVIDAIQLVGNVASIAVDAYKSTPSNSPPASTSANTSTNSVLPQPSDPAQSTISDISLCRVALTANRQGWETSQNSGWAVREAQTRGHSIATCQRALDNSEPSRIPARLSEDEINSRLAEIVRLRDSGAISAATYENRRREILGQ